MNKTELIETTFDRLDRHCAFVVLRNFHRIPEHSSFINDIDLLIRKSDKAAFSDSMKELGFQLAYDSGIYAYGAEPHIHCCNRELDTHFDVVVGLYYRSINNPNLFIGGFEELEESIWDHKVHISNCWKYEPSIEDQLTHLCCHSIFDKRQMTATYESRINKLYNQSDKTTLNGLFSLAFHQAGDHLLSVIEKGQCSNLCHEYIQYSDY